MSGDPRVRLSKRLAYHLRHDPSAAGIELDESGWADLDELLDALDGVDRREIEEVLAAPGKERFELSPDGRRIRARYGHSVVVDPGHRPAEPPSVLFHGTTRRRLPRIQDEGLRRMGRRQVHLSTSVEEAEAVGRRHGEPVVLEVDAARMAREGFVFSRASDGVWLVDHAPPGYLRVV